MTIRKALTIAGSDSVLAPVSKPNLKTFAALGVYGTSAITAITAQNTIGVTAVLAVNAKLVWRPDRRASSPISAPMRSRPACSQTLQSSTWWPRRFASMVC